MSWGRGDFDPQSLKTIQQWTDQKIVDELRNTTRATIPDTWLPILVEAVARLLENKASTMEPKRKRSRP